MDFQPNFLTTLIGSVPYHNTSDTCDRIMAAVDLPVWPQMVRLGFRENMYTQYGAVLPSIRIDDQTEKITFDTAGDLTTPLEAFYTHYLEEDLDYFALQTSHAVGFYAMVERLSRTSGTWVKGQVTGPVSMGLTVTDQDRRASLYNEMLVDVLVKNAAMNARWQIRSLKSVRPQVIIFVDEPYMASFGSAFISLSRDQVIVMLDEVFDAIHAEAGLAGVHCCANTDWSVLLETSVDILNLDAYEYLDNLALYPHELRKFLDRGGIVAWGIVPNTQEIFSVTPQQLVQQLRTGITLVCEKAAARGVFMEPREFETRSLVTPACGLGSASTAVADEVLSVLVQVGRLLQR
jgi:methionine synthase II (cobalamin-independent)